MFFLLNRGTKGFLKQLAKINRGCHRGCPEAKHPIRDMVEDGTYQYTGVWRNSSFAVPCVIESRLEKGTFSLLAVRLQRVHSFIPSFVHSEHSLAHSLACFAQRAAVERPVARRAKHARLGTSLIPFTHSFTMPLRFEFPLTYPSLTHPSSSFISQALFLRVAAQSVVGRLDCP